MMAVYEYYIIPKYKETYIVCKNNEEEKEFYFDKKIILCDGEFKQKNIALKKAIAKQFMDEYPFVNKFYLRDDMYKSLSLYRKRICGKKENFVVVNTNALLSCKNNKILKPFSKSIKPVTQCKSVKTMEYLEKINIIVFALFFLLYFIVVALSCVNVNDCNIDRIECFAFLLILVNYFFSFTGAFAERFFAGKSLKIQLWWLYYDCRKYAIPIKRFFVFVFSIIILWFFISKIDLVASDITNVLSILGFAFFFLDGLIEVFYHLKNYRL